jgi:hypothetical protein
MRPPRLALSTPAGAGVALRRLARPRVPGRSRSFHAHPPSPVDGAHDPHNALAHLAPPPSQSQTHAGPSTGPLAGWSASVKANLCTRDMPTTCGSAMLRGALVGGGGAAAMWRRGADVANGDGARRTTTDYTSPFDATVVQRLRAAGAVVVGKTNCDEFGMGCVLPALPWRLASLSALNIRAIAARPTCTPCTAPC